MGGPCLGSGLCGAVDFVAFMFNAQSGQKDLFLIDVAMERRGQLNESNWRDAKTVVGVCVECVCGCKGEFLVILENVKKDTSVDNPAHSSSPSRSWLPNHFLRPFW